MSVLRIDHPDIEEFITCKDKDGEVSNFNISVGITDAFMDAVEKGQRFALVHPHNGRPAKTVEARELFKLLYTQAWKNGEPGILFLDTINNDHPLDDEIEASNPCFRGDMKLRTIDGDIPFVELAGKEVKIVNSDGCVVLGKVWKSGEEEIWEVKTENRTLYCTEDHVFMTFDGREIQAKNLLDESLFLMGSTAAIGPDKVISVRNTRKVEPVYDFSEPMTHWGIVEGVVVHNCGETPLLPNESCNLGSINLSNFYDPDTSVDYPRLANTVRTAVQFLDNIIDLNEYPLPEIEAATKHTRKIGLGIMGFADLLIKLKIRYGSPESIELARTIIGFMHEEATKYSMELAETQGTYPAYVPGPYPPLRNATVITIAPTGTLSIIAGCSGGIEPNFAFKYIRRVMDTELEEVHPLYPTEGPVPDYFVTAQEVTPEEHVNMQAAFQEYTDNAISKTINMSHNATADDVRKVFEQAFRMGCKGITVYRDGSRANQVLDTNNGTKSRPKARPASLEGTTSKVKTGCGTMFGTINHDENGVCELFTRIGKSGGCAAAFTEATSRIISIALRSGIHVDEIIDQLKNIHCPNGTWDNGTRIFSCPDAMARLLLRHLDKDEPQETTNMPCPECQSPMIKESGCYRCTCGYSRCG